MEFNRKGRGKAYFPAKIMNKQKFAEVVLTNNDTYNTLASAIGLAESSLQNKVLGRLGGKFNASEIEAIAKRYSLTDAQVKEIFD